MEEKKKWTVFFLMHAVKEFHQQAIGTIRSILSVDINEQVAVIFCLNIDTKNLPAEFEWVDPRPPNRVTTLFYVIEKDRDGKNKLGLLKENADFRFGDPQFIGVFFKDEVLRYNMAEHYLLITWDHGQPFGVFPSSDSDSEPAAKIVANDEKLCQPLLVHFRLWDAKKRELDFKKSAADNGNSGDPLPAHGNMLTISELRQAIEWAFGSQKIDVVVMFNCYLQYFDTGYELASCVHYLAAFEMNMFFDDSLNYPGIFKALSANPRIEPMALVKGFVSTFALSNNEGERQTKNEVVFSANDLTWYPEMARLIDELGDALLMHLPHSIEKIQAALEKCRYLTNAAPEYRLIDFRNIVDRLYGEIPEAFPTQLYANLINVLDKIVLESYIGSDYHNESGPPFYSPGSFSIYFPDSLDAAATSFFNVFVNPQSFDASEFAKSFGWVTFIEKFVTIVDS